VETGLFIYQVFKFLILYLRLMENRIWLITGCSTGFGRELARLVAEKGEIAFGTVRKNEQVADLEALHPERIHGLVLDVQDQSSIDRAIKRISTEFGRLDVLVNNAGYGSLGPVEETTEQEMQRQFDVNVFGCVRMIKAVLPFMRRQRSGNILNITSIAGLNGFPGVGIYNGSKFALEGIGEALAAETRHLGIKVTNVEPGPFRTDWAGRSATYSTTSIPDYEESAHKNMDAISGNSGKQVGDPKRAVEAMYDLTLLDSPPVHLPLGGPAYKRARIKMNEMLKEIDDFEYLGLPTDYTEDELKQMGD
jgi:NAD(P)-dependent dehydrogenase (short-subunit alcohol dehydrogenase family)